jgi:hypothetical protein
MRNSIVETENINASISKIEQMKTYYPTEAEFSDPLIYIDSLVRDKDARKFGCVKIVPPASFKMTCAFDRESSQKLPTRF